MHTDGEQFAASNDAPAGVVHPERSYLDYGLEADTSRVPSNFFGRVPEEFYGFLGRVVEVAALMESKLNDLVTRLCGAVQSTYAGQDVARSVDLARRMLVPVPLRHSTPHALATRTLDLLDRVENAAYERNEVVQHVRSRPARSRLRG
jgi:hypothetical protein